MRGADVHGAGVAAEDTDGTVAVGGGHDAVPVALFGDVRPYGVGAAPLVADAGPSPSTRLRTTSSASWSAVQWNGSPECRRYPPPYTAPVASSR